jgi:hypothetical protein
MPFDAVELPPEFDGPSIFGPFEGRYSLFLGSMLMAVAELDYAYLADYVSIQEGKLTAVGASFTFAATASLPIQSTVGVAGRVRAKATESVEIEIRITPPDDAFHLSFTGTLDAGPKARPYGDGNVGLLFAINTELPIDRVGLYTYDIYVDGVHSRRLAFEIEQTDAS